MGNVDLKYTGVAFLALNVLKKLMTRIHRRIESSPNFASIPPEIIRIGAKFDDDPLRNIYMELFFKNSQLLLAIIFNI